MKWGFDTSVLIPVFPEDLQSHERCFAAFAAADRKVACCAAHSLAEVCAAITRLPGKYRMSGEQVMLMMGEIEQRCTIVSLDAREYLKVIRQAAANGIAGETIYDALSAGCATKAKAEIIYTDNEKHFRLLDFGDCEPNEEALILTSRMRQGLYRQV